jgi:hypothetical protein
VEVMGFEPTASTLRMWRSWAFYQGITRDALVGPLRSPQVPSLSIPFPFDKVTHVHVCDTPSVPLSA